ncbi:hypothetical protein OROHE_024964 [Orobanche hederae]
MQNPVFEGNVNWDVKDIWHEIASKLDGSDILGLALTNRYFWGILMENSVWKQACLNKLGIVEGSGIVDPAAPWFDVYAMNASHMYTRYPDGHLNWERRLGGFVFNSSDAILSTDIFRVYGASAEHQVETMLESKDNYVLLTDIKRGIRIADSHQITCIQDECEHTIISFDARNIELFMREEFVEGHCSYKFGGLHSADWSAPGFTTSACIFDKNHIKGAANIRAFDDPSWEGEQAIVTPNGVAVKTNVTQFHHKGLVVSFYQTMSIGGEIFAIRVSFVA